MNSREAMARKIATIETRGEMAAFLDALRVEAPEIAGDAEIQRLIGEQQARIYRTHIIAAEADSWRKRK